MATYDTPKIRHAAMLTKRLANTMTAEVKPEIREAGGGIERLKGKTAQAMDERLTVLEAENRAIVSELENLARQLDRYASLLEAADEQLAKML